MGSLTKLPIRHNIRQKTISEHFTVVTMAVALVTQVCEKLKQSPNFDLAPDWAFLSSPARHSLKSFFLNLNTPEKNSY